MGLGSQFWILSVAHEEEPIRSHVIINHQLTTVSTVLCLGTPGGPPDRADCRKAPVCIYKQYSGNYNFGTFYVSHAPVVHQPLWQPRTRHPQISHLYSLHRDPRQEVHTAAILLMTHGSHSRVYHARFSLWLRIPCSITLWLRHVFLVFSVWSSSWHWRECWLVILWCVPKLYVPVVSSHDSLSCWSRRHLLCDRYVSVSDLYLWPNVLFAAILVWGFIFFYYHLFAVVFACTPGLATGKRTIAL